MSRNFALEVESIISQLQPIRAEVLQAEQHFRGELDNVHLGTLQSARNLVHYVSLRRHDLRELQQDLGRLAVSSLGRLESHVIATLDALLALFARLQAKSGTDVRLRRPSPNSIRAQPCLRNTRLNRLARRRTIAMFALWSPCQAWLLAIRISFAIFSTVE
jgi:hypothetical protein